MSDLSQLSERELEILRLVATGAGNKEIAQKLVISANTVKVHLRNIFAKIGVSTRTEASMWAVRNGLVTPFDSGGLSGESLEEPAAGVWAETSLLDSLTPDAEPGAPAGRSAWLRPWALALAAAVLLISGVLLARLWFPAASSPGVTGEPAADATPVPRWRERTALPGARAGLAAAAYEGQIYAIGGEDAQGPVAAVERYDPQSDGWQALAPKPLAVTDVQAGVIGGKLYLPGGRVDAAAVTDRLEIYDPRQDRWSQGAALPVGLSAYALATFEGRLYLFGGWDGKQYTGQALVYDPALDAWQQLAPMPTWRGFAGAAVAEGKIYVIGGQDENGPLAVNEAYLPDLDQAGSQPWTQAAALPSGRSAMGIASLAEVIHVIGGQAGGAPLLSYAYAPQTDSWQELYFPPGEGWSHLGVVPLGTYLYTLGGKVGDGLSAQNIVYQAIFTVAIPVIR